MPRKPICYTFSGEKGLTLDDRLAARVAETCGLEHKLVRIAPDFFSDFAMHADRTVYLTDGCFGITGAHEIYLNRRARELAPVRLTGNYGREVLRGVSTFKQVRLSPSLLNPRFPLNPSAGHEVNGGKHPITFAAFSEIPSSLFGSLAAVRSQVSVRTPYLDNDLVALAYQAPHDLRQSTHPASSLIKANKPLLSKIPTDRRQSIEGSGPLAALKRFFCEVTFALDYLNNEGCPHWLSPFDATFNHLTSGLKIVGLHKYLHYRSWFRRELADYVKRIATDARTERSPFWNFGFVNQMASQHSEGHKNYVHEINVVLTLEATERLLLQG